LTAEASLDGNTSIAPGPLELTTPICMLPNVCATAAILDVWLWCRMGREVSGYTGEAAAVFCRTSTAIEAIATMRTLAT
jgi:hypothetical protein